MSSWPIWPPADRWVMDGNYSATFDLRMPRAEALVFLDIPVWRCLAGVYGRAWRHRGRVRPNLPDGCPERWPDGRFLHWIITYPWRSRPRLMKAIRSSPAPPCVQLHRPAIGVGVARPATRRPDLTARPCGRYRPATSTGSLARSRPRGASTSARRRRSPCNPHNSGRSRPDGLRRARRRPRGRGAPTSRRPPGSRPHPRRGGTGCRPSSGSRTCIRRRPWKKVSLPSGTNRSASDASPTFFVFAAVLLDRDLSARETTTGDRHQAGLHPSAHEAALEGEPHVPARLQLLHDEARVDGLGIARQSVRRGVVRP